MRRQKYRGTNNIAINVNRSIFPPCIFPLSPVRLSDPLILRSAKSANKLPNKYTINGRFKKLFGGTFSKIFEDKISQKQKGSTQNAWARPFDLFFVIIILLRLFRCIERELLCL